MGGGDPLALDRETMRRLGYLTVDLLVDQVADPGGGRALTRATPAEMQARIGRPPPVAGEPFEDVLAQLWTDVLPYASRCEHPRYFAFIPANGNWPSALGDLIASAVNPYVGSWMEAAGPSQVELEVLRWFAGWIGYPESAAGILVSGGSQANLTALACAREARLGLMSDAAVVYVSDQAHSSLARAARVLGFQPHQVRVLPVDSSFRLRPGTVAEAIAADRRMGRVPLFVSAAAGATNTGAVDPLPELAEVCAADGVWLHVDAAYGGFATLTKRGAAALTGIELADSVTLDPHKWLYQPFECGSLLVRDGRLLRSAFTITPDYLKDAEAESEEVNFADLGMQLTRGFKALKVWLSLRTFGTAAFARAIDNCIDAALAAQARIQADSELELLSGASLGIVCFRRNPPQTLDDDQLDRVNAELVARYARSGDGLVSSTRLRGAYAVRLCILNHTSTPADVEAVLDWFANEPLARAAGPVGNPPDRDAPVGRVLGPAGASPDPVPEEARLGLDALRRVPLFARLRPSELEHVAMLATERIATAGEPLIEQWSLDRDFYVVLEGVAVVVRDGHEVTEILPGGYFGELAALEWGASFAYSRTATVTARTPTRLAVLKPAALAALMVSSPDLEREIMHTRRQRLARIQRDEGSPAPGSSPESRHSPLGVRRNSTQRTRRNPN